MVDKFLRSCELCAARNVGKHLTAPISHIPETRGPFRHLMMDFVDMADRKEGKRYILVVIDHFSRWVEATATAKNDTKTVGKFLIREVIPRFGIPDKLSSDNGPHFVNNVIKAFAEALCIKQRMGCDYHPQSQGMVERANGVLKEKIAKICASTDLNWVQALPLALMKMRSQTNRNTHLTPHELLTGRPMPVAFTQGPYTGSSLDQLEADMSSYCKHLMQIHRTLYSQVCEATHGAQVDEPLQQVQPGDYVYIKVFKRKHWSEPRREGPFKVVLATPTAVKVEGKEYWYHLNHCCRAAVKGPQWRKSQAELAHCAHSDDSEDDDDGAGPAQDRGPAYRTRAKTKQPQPVEGKPKAGCSYQVDSRPPHGTLDSDKVEETVRRLLDSEDNTFTPPEQFGTLNLQDLVDLDIHLP
ncbi:hypothetical protein HF521_006902, partial [Silurus meridionalis]